MEFYEMDNHDFCLNLSTPFLELSFQLRLDLCGGE